jgi:hypothetical protein
VQEPDGAGEVASEDDGAAQDDDEQEVALRVVPPDLGAELADPRAERGPVEVDLSEPVRPDVRRLGRATQRDRVRT